VAAVQGGAPCCSEAPPHRPDFLTTGRSANAILPVNLRPTLKKAKLSVLAIFVLPLELSVPFVSARLV
jgi:hypothetical protein